MLFNLFITLNNKVYDRTVITFSTIYAIADILKINNYILQLIYLHYHIHMCDNVYMFPYVDVLLFKNC